jgi:hypothetical protein
VVDAAGTTEPLILHLAPSGSMSFGPMYGQWRFARGLLTIKAAAGNTITYNLTRKGRYIHMEGGDLDAPVDLEKMP